MLTKVLDNKAVLGFLMGSAYVGGVLSIAGGFYVTYLLVTWLGASP